ncbi:hypothetical protein DIZ27_33680 [Streptomyces sp. NWU339]|uniref:hypothetical protein n=1 Tax=Streptomyces sp. NWU339 TaxID=2185284 RepID=UPI000D67AC39|nr:hypothetical protein [Streptomyces sp. NWU339]PWI06444.1 hypothetical protein DIZ27_33680 [Streptomyces sp. NWU339]
MTEKDPDETRFPPSLSSADRFREAGPAPMEHLWRSEIRAAPVEQDERAEKPDQHGEVEEAENEPAHAAPVEFAPAPQTREVSTRIGVWGSPASGKTTFLGALRLAALDPAGPFGRWQVVPSDDVSERFLVETARKLAIDKVFPPATQAVRPYAWRFRGDLSGTAFGRRRLWRRRPANRLEFELSVLDVPGGAYEDLRSDGIAARSIDHLARAQGLVYLFDPLREAQDSDSFAYLNGTLTRITRLCMQENRLDGPYLPHHLAVCLTKFDDPEVFDRARRGGWTDLGPNGVPVVSDPAGFFDWLADDLHGSTMRLVGQTLRANFHPARLHFFTTSAIGFGTMPGGSIDLRRFGNVNVVDGGYRIVGPLRPYNVMDPLVALLLGMRNGSRP